MSEITSYVRVSELDPIKSMAATDLMLVSRPKQNSDLDDDSATDEWHQSYKVSYYDLQGSIISGSGIKRMRIDIDNLSNYVSVQCLHKEDTELQVTRTPYVISAIAQRYGKIEGLSGYMLSDVISDVLDATPVNNITANYIDVSRINVTSAVYGIVRDGPATESNRLVTEQFVNSSIQHSAASYVTKDISGNAFSTFTMLSSQTKRGDLYIGGARSNPSRNDYCVVLSDETVPDRYPGIPGGVSAVYTVRYQWSDTAPSPLGAGLSGWWQFMYIVNNSPYTAAQWDAINSGINVENRVYRSGYGYDSKDDSYVPVYVDSDGKVVKSKDFRDYFPVSKVEEWRFYMENSNDIVHKKVAVLSSWVQRGG